MNQQIAQRQAQLKPVLMSAQRQITSLLQDKEKANKFMAASLVIASDQSLNRCSPDSIVQALIGIAMSDLNVDKNIGHAYLVPYGNQAQLQIGYKGFIQLLFRAGWLVKCFPVFHCDTFSMSFDGWDNHVEFEPNIDERNEGDRDWCYQNLRGIYVVSRHAETKDEYSTFINKTVIEKLRLTSPMQKAQPSGAWKDWYIEMAQAKAIKKLAKILPVGDTRTLTTLSMDDKTDSGSQIDYKKTAESGVIIEADQEEQPDLQTLTNAINNAQSESELNKLTDDIRSLSDEDKKTIRAVWTEKLKQFEQKPSTEEKIKACTSQNELTALIESLSETEQLELSDLIDESYNRLLKGDF